MPASPSKPLPAEIDERAIQQASGLVAARRHRGIACARESRCGIVRRAGQFVVGADQTLALGTRLFSKPAGRVAGCGAAARAGRRQPRTAFRRCRRARWQDIVRSSFHCTDDHAVAWRGRNRRLSGTKRERPSPPASALTSSRDWACICSSVSRAIISPSSVCRCCHCWRFCAASGCSACEGKSLQAANGEI